MDEKIKEIEKNIQPKSYLNSFKAIEHIKYLLSECERLGRLYDLELGRSNKAENQHFIAIQKVDELERRIQLAEATRDDALAYAKMYKAKINKLETALEITSGALEGSQGVVKELEDEIVNLKESRDTWRDAYKRR